MKAFVAAHPGFKVIFVVWDGDADGGKSTQAKCCGEFSGAALFKPPAPTLPLRNRGSTDLANRSIDMHFLEGSETYSFGLYDNDPEKWNIGATGDDTVTAWTNETGLLFIEGVGKMRGFGSDGAGVPWSPESVTAVVISDGVTSVGTNAWYGLADGVTYNGLSSSAARTLIDGFGGALGYARTPFRDIQVGGGIVQLAVALETTPSLTDEWTEVKLKAGSVDVDSNGRIIIQHQTENQDQGYYIMQPVK